MRARSLWLMALVFGLSASGLLSTAAYAGDPIVPIVGCFVAGGVSVPAGSQVTFRAGWTIATRGNTQAFANAATGIMTVDGAAVTSVQSDVFPVIGAAEPLDAWRVQWSFTTTAPAAGQSMVVPSPSCSPEPSPTTSLESAWPSSFQRGICSHRSAAP